MRGSRSAALVLVALACLTLAACDSDPEEPQARPTPTTTPEPPPVCPLSGEDIPKGLDEERAAVAIKVENSSAARPQSGLEDAEIVFEEIVEGGITRFMAIYHCTDAPKVGPVRSARFDDAKIAKPFTRVLAFSGGNAIVERELLARKMIPLQENDAGSSLYRVPAGVLELHNLFADTKELRKLPAVKKARAPSEGLFEFGPLPDSAKKARRVSMNFTASNTIEYRWQKGAWRRYEAGAPFQSATGSQIAVPNVLIQEVIVKNSPRITDSAGNPSPDITLTGKGKALLFRGGKVQVGKWKVTKEGKPAVFQTKTGEPFTFEPGPIWIELVPSRRGQVKGSVSYR